MTVLLGDPAVVDLVAAHGRDAVVNTLREAVERCRSTVLADAGQETDCSTAAIVRETKTAIESSDGPNLRRIVNATGIVLHTGLGRAVLPQAALDAVANLWSCCNVQIDLDSGGRIKREAAIRDIVIKLTGAEDVVLVNNNAGATLLVLRALAAGKEVVVSRGELIEIGGSFRLPDIMRESGAIMREVGTTNKTHLRDYARAIDPDATALLFKAHKSNYEIVGFTAEVTICELATLGREHGIAVADDLGCGALVPLECYGLPHEMTMRESLAAGADVVLSSTDKLIGGPQGALIVGRKELLDRIRAHPLYRALRVDKITIAALEATLRLFLNPDRLEELHPTYMMLARTQEEMKEQGAQIAGEVSAQKSGWDISVVEEPARLGGGSLPGAELPSYAVRIRAPRLGPDQLARRLRLATTPVAAYAHDDAVFLNMRTVLPREARDVAGALLSIDED